jgi:hypothetical protein
MPTPTAAQLSEVIAQVAAPAFILGAVAAFILVLNERLNRVIDRLQELNAISGDDVARAYLKADVPRLKASGLRGHAGSYRRQWRAYHHCGGP